MPATHLSPQLGAQSQALVGQVLAVRADKDLRVVGPALDVLTLFELVEHGVDALDAEREADRRNLSTKTHK